MPFSLGIDGADSLGRAGGFGVDPNGGLGADERFDSGSEL